MALPASGNMSGSQWLTEFATSAPKSATDFYKGGSLVPNIPANASVPTSGTMLGSNFYGATNRTFGLALGPIDVAASFFSSASFVIYRDGSTPWTVPTTTNFGDGYEVRVTQNSGTTLTGTLGTWQVINTNRSWSLDNSTAGTTVYANITIEIRVTSGAVVCSETLDLSAEVFP